LSTALCACFHINVPLVAGIFILVTVSSASHSSSNVTFYYLIILNNYDNLFAPNLSGEWRLDRPFRRRLQSKLKRQH